MTITIRKRMIITSSLVMILLFVFKLRWIIDKLFFSFLEHGRRSRFSCHLRNFGLFIRFVLIMIIICLSKVVLSHHKIILFLVLHSCCNIKELLFVFISFSGNLLVKERLVKHLSIVCLCPVKTICNWRFLFINEIDLVWSLGSSHWRVWFNVALF